MSRAIPKEKCSSVERIPWGAPKQLSYIDEQVIYPPSKFYVNKPPEVRRPRGTRDRVLVQQQPRNGDA